MNFNKYPKSFLPAYLWTLIGLFSLSLPELPSLQAQDKVKYRRHYLSGKDAGQTVEWDFKVSDGRNNGKWAKIPVPSNWELQGFGTYNYGHDHKNPDRVLGKEIGEYRHSFMVPNAWKGQRINLVFDGSMTDTEVKINGKSAGEIHQGGFYRFKFDITNLLQFGKNNLLEVSVLKHSKNASVNRAEREADFWIFGGIFRPVFLEILSESHFERIAIDPKADGEFQALLTLNEPLAGGGQVRVELYDQLGQTQLGVLEQDIHGDSVWVKGKFEGVSNWHAEQPNLYLAKFSLIQNGEIRFQKEERIGFRTIELRPNDGFYVNGERVVFKGVNRHSFYPKTGRALSETNHLEDISLMKEMNMNAVRMSHYPPDERFLDLCDSLGLFVLDEVAGWQQGYDTIVGPKLIRETILKDANHPSILIWDHGNEGGWDFANEKWFHVYDIQKRPVIYPWLQKNQVDTHHYPRHQQGINRLSNGADPFMPTELLHGLYDGGHGAGLEDFWKDYMGSPLASGGFLWVFSDEAVVRTDKAGILDADGNHAPDGILGPYREKEGSFYTIKNIWSPVQVKPISINEYFDGRLWVENRYHFTNLAACTYSWKAQEILGLDSLHTLASGEGNLPEALPGETRVLSLALPDDFTKADLFSFTATAPDGQELYTWTWLCKVPKKMASKWIDQPKDLGHDEGISLEERSGQLLAKAGGLDFVFDLTSGSLNEVKPGSESIPLSGGPFPVGKPSNWLETTWQLEMDGSLSILTQYDAYPKTTIWRLYPSGILHLEVAPIQQGMDEVDFIGISFNMSEDLCTGVKWLGKGPYRVWKNRMKGAEFGLWEKAYNNTVTGHSFENLVYPEFKGYHANLYAVEIQTESGDFKIISETPNLFMRLFTPENAPFATEGVKVPFPEGDISFLYHIPPIGTKFSLPAALGPASQLGRTGAHNGDEAYPISLWFDFRAAD